MKSIIKSPLINDCFICFCLQVLAVFTFITNFLRSRREAACKYVLSDREKRIEKYFCAHNELIKRVAHKYQSAHSAHVKIPANFVFHVCAVYINVYFPAPATQSSRDAQTISIRRLQIIKESLLIRCL